MRHRLALLMLVLWPLMATAQTTVSGRITDRDTGAPIHGLRVDLRTIYNTEPAAPLATWTDTDGRYTLADVPPGR